MALPLVAVPAYTLRPGRVQGWEDASSGVPHAYVAGLLRAGVRPALLAATDPGPPDEVLAPFAALVLVGGGDVDPARYGGPDHPLTYGVDRDRDRFELDLARAAVAAGLPLLAICRGLQVLNVALGGTLLAHLPDDPTLGLHGHPEVDGALARHPVTLAPGSRLAATLGGAALASCVSVHHQAIDGLGAGLVVTGRSPDGVVEAVEGTGPGWVLGVQWHPERTAAADPQQQAVFDAMSAAIGAR